MITATHLQSSVPHVTSDTFTLPLPYYTVASLLLRTVEVVSSHFGEEKGYSD